MSSHPKPNGSGARSTAIVASSENRAGTLLVTFDADGQSKLWRADGTSVALGVVKGSQPGALRWATYSEDNKLICTGGELGTARVWETATGKELFSIPDRVYGARFSKDGSKVVTVGSDNVARIWEVKTGREYLTLRGHGALVAQATFSPDGLRAATAGVNGIVKLWSATTGREVLHGDLWTWGPCYSPDGKRVASTSSGLDMRVWDADSGEELLRFRPDMEDTMTAQFSPDGRFIATGGGEGVAHLWDSPTGYEVRAFQGHTRCIQQLSFSPDGRRLATASYDQTARIWDVETGRQLHVLHGHSNRLWQAWFSPDGGRLATAGADLVGRVWDVQSGRLLFTLGSGSAPAMLLRFTPDGRRIFTSSREKNFRIWDAFTGQLLDTWPLRNAATLGFDFTPDGKRMVATLSENTTAGYDLPMLELWDVENGRDLLSLRGHTEPVWQMFFRHDGRRILTSSGDMTTRQWETFPWRQVEYPGSRSLRERIAAYSRDYWRERLRVETEVARKPTPPPVQPLFRWDRSRWSKRDERAGPNQIDLTEHYTGILGVSFHPHGGAFDNHLRTMPTGTVTLSNVVFDIRGVIQLRRLEPLGGAFRLNSERQPVRADGIKVGKTFHRLQVLHAVSADSSQIPDGTQVGSYLLHYSDGTRAELPILYGRHLREWWTRGADPAEARKPIENGTVVWTGTNPAAQENGSTLRLYLSSYDNPRPEIEVVSIDYVSAMTQAAPFLVAMTIEP